MKKLICLLLALAMTLSLAACGSKADDKMPEEDNPAQAETPIDDKQDEPAADDTDKDEKSGTVVIEPDANKDEKSDEAQKPAEPTKSDSKKDETPASKPSEPTKPAETPSETPAETPTAQDTGALSLLTSVWSTYSEDDKFPAAGGDASNVSTVAADIRSAVQGKQWMCGFPEKLVILTSGQYVVSVYGNESLVNTFRDKFVAAHSGASTVYDEAIGA